MFNLRIKRGRNLAIDLGNSNTIITEKFTEYHSQPSVVALNQGSKSVNAVGMKAYEMIGKVSSNLNVVKPIKGGVIADYDSATKMLKALMEKAYPHKSFFGYKNIVSGVPYSTTEVERRALRDAIGQFNCSNTYLLFEPLAAAIGLGLDIREPDGKFIVGVGGGITETVLISLSGVVAYKSIKIGGETFDEEIQDYFRRTHKIEIGINTAEVIKIKVGAATDNLKNAPEPYLLVGKDMMTGIPVNCLIDYKEVAHILDNSLLKIEQAILQTLEECPPELASDIYNNGIHLTGGSALLRGLKERFEEKIGLQFHLDPDALLSVSKGISTVLKDTEGYKSVLFK
ncbi:MAG: rod shape-determining protein [Bacteroidota bacterium]|nr:rod shape-determining protein [Bacteroidota bacterium]